MKPFKSKKHKKKVNHLILFTSDAADGRVRQLRLSPAVFKLLVLLFCILVGIVTGFLIYGGSWYQQFQARAAQQKETIAVLTQEKEELLTEKEALTEKVEILSQTVNQKVQAEKEAAALSEEMSLPTEFPLTGSAQVEETTVQQLREAQMVGYYQNPNGNEEEKEEEEDQPICIFTASEGTTAIAAGTGTVLEAKEDLNYGYRVVIDHGNGYQSIYLNKAEPKVKEGETVERSATLFVIGSENTMLGYQMLKDGKYINPMEMISISG